MTIQPNPDWPVLTTYEGRRLDRVALPLGGIGTGTVSLGGRGDLRDWEIVNRPAKGLSPDHTFFALRAQSIGGEAVVRALEGVLRPHYEAARGEFAPNHSLPRFRSCEFRAAYPFGQVLLSDPDVPLAVRIEAFNPFIPADPERSGLPVAILRFVLDNPGDTPVAAAIAGSLQNFIGTDGTNGAPAGNVNEARLGDGLSGVLLRSRGVSPDSEQWGTIALATTATEAVSHRTAWADVNWGDALLDFWDDFGDDGRLDDRPIGTVEAPVASLAIEVDVPARSSRSITFLLAWHFPNRRAWGLSPRGGVNSYTDEIVGNYYATRFADAWDVARAVARDLPTLEARHPQLRPRLLRRRPAADREGGRALQPEHAAHPDLLPHRRRPLLRLGGLQRHDRLLSRLLHPRLELRAGDRLPLRRLARSMREVEFRHATRDDGHMSFRVHLPLEHASDRVGPRRRRRADGLPDEALPRLAALRRRRHAPRALAAGTEVAGVLLDPRRLGCRPRRRDGGLPAQHDGRRVLRPQSRRWASGTSAPCAPPKRWRATSARSTSPPTCRDLFERGRRWIDEHLFNGEYYEHQDLAGQATRRRSRRGCATTSMGARDLADPDLQLGAGCLVDQLVGQYMAQVCGLGYLVDPGRTSGRRCERSCATTSARISTATSTTCGPSPSTTSPRC